MNTLGIIGGMSPESTAAYYTQINRLINRQKGGNHSAPILLASVEFQEIVDCQQRGDWHKAGEILAHAARTLEQAGADAVLLATNTMHKVATPIQAAIGVPFLHILDSVAERGIQAIVPDEGAQAEIHHIIFEELCVGNFPESSRRFYVQTIEQLAAQGAEGIILGCTEIGLLVRPEDTAVPLFDTTAIHVQAAAEFILQPT